jgi:predicted MFS family arabinose efflux permease
LHPWWWHARPISTTEDKRLEPRASTPSTRAPALWRNRDYAILWSGQTVSSIGTGVSDLAFPLLILTLTHSPAQAGIVAALRALPYLFFSLPAGALVDRWERKRAMIACDTGRALALCSIPVAQVLGVLSIAQLFAVSFIEGTFFVFFSLAETAALPQVVPQTQLPAATAANNAAYGVTALVGPSLGGALYAVGQVIPFAADAVSYACSVVSLLFIRTRFQRDGRATRRGLRHEIGEGVRWLWGNPLVRYMAFLTAGLRVGGGLTLIVIVLAQHAGASPPQIGLIFGVSGVGAILGSLVAPLVQRRLSFGRAIVTICWSFAVLNLLLATARGLVALAIMLFLIECVAPAYDTVQFSYRLALIPDALQGRVNSVFRMIATIVQPLALAGTGWLLEHGGTTPTILTLGGWFVVLSIVTSLNRHVRTAPPIGDVQIAA